MVDLKAVACGQKHQPDYTNVIPTPGGTDIAVTIFPNDRSK